MTNLEVIWFRQFKAVFWLIPIEFPIVVVILRLVAKVFAIWRQGGKNSCRVHPNIPDMKCIKFRLN